MSLLNGSLRPKDILVGSTATNESEVLDFLFSSIADNEGLLSGAGAKGDLLARTPKELATFVGNGVWLPHVRTSHVRGIIVAVATFPQAWEPRYMLAGSEKVQMTFLVLAQVGLVNEYLHIVGEIARRLSKSGRVKELVGSQDGEEWERSFTGP